MDGLFVGSLCSDYDSLEPSQEPFQWHRWSLLILLPELVLYQWILLMIIGYLRQRPIVQRTTLDQLFQTWCTIQLMPNLLRKMLLIWRVATGQTMSPVFSVLYSLCQSTMASLFFNFFAAICFIRYVYVFHWGLAAMWPDEVIFGASVNVTIIVTIVQLLAEYGTLAHLQGSLFYNHYVWIFSDCCLVRAEVFVTKQIIVTAYKLVLPSFIATVFYIRLYCDKTKQDKSATDTQNMMFAQNPSLKGRNPQNELQPRGCNCDYNFVIYNRGEVQMFPATPNGQPDREMTGGQKTKTGSAKAPRMRGSRSSSSVVKISSVVLSFLGIASTLVYFMVFQDEESQQQRKQEEETRSQFIHHFTLLAIKPVMSFAFLAGIIFQHRGLRRHLARKLKKWQGILRRDSPQIAPIT